MTDHTNDPPPPPATPTPNPAPGGGNTPPAKGPWIYSGVPESQEFYTPPKPHPVPDRPTPVAAASTPKTMPEPVAAKVTPAKPVPSTPVKKTEEEGDTSLAGIIDTIEAIIIALVIALTFRAFIVEAFVIPTGSMAPTLLGAHFHIRCPSCGYEYDRNADLRWKPDGKNLVQMNGEQELEKNDDVPCLDSVLHCPNCRYPILPNKDDMRPLFLGMKHYSVQGRARDVPYIWTDNGDRILVLKFLYSVSDPSRYDVIVFREPETIAANYIKRCVGLPGEAIQIINGDVYISAKGSINPKDLQIARKPSHVQKALWQLVFDNDYLPKEAASPQRLSTLHFEFQDFRYEVGRWINPWQAVARPDDWQAGIVMKHTAAGKGELRFNLVPVDPGLDPASKKLYPPYTLNTNGYNDDAYVDDFGNEGQSQFAPRSFVGDLRVETLWTPQDNPGITMTVGRPANCYRAVWNAGELALYRFHPESGQSERVAAAVTNTAPLVGDSHHVALENVDRVARFFIDGKLVLSYEQPWNAEEALADFAANNPDWSNSPTHPEMVANNAQPNTVIQIDVDGKAHLAHLKLLRDLYYTRDFGNTTTGTAEPYVLGKDEFFAMGDNSRSSKDSRLWTTVHPALADLEVRKGIVPRRYLLGKAVFVYWPAGYRASSTINWLDKLPLVPNTGDMRLIR